MIWDVDNLLLLKKYYPQGSKKVQTEFLKLNIRVTIFAIRSMAAKLNLKVIR